jgi:hypothetical protein
MATERLIDRLAHLARLGRSLHHSGQVQAANNAHIHTPTNVVQPTMVLNQTIRT